MHFDMRVSNQAEIFEDKMKASLYRKLNQVAKKTGWIRLTGPGIGIVSGVLTLFKRVALIGENVIKGITNLLTGLCLKEYNFKQGLIQTFYQIPKNAIIFPFAVVSAVIGLIAKPLFIALIPIQYTEDRWRFHSHIKLSHEDLVGEKV